MDDNDVTNLDLEFKRYLQLLRPYLTQLIDEDVIKICDMWIQRLSSCSDNEKALRNNYVFRLCYQLARGVLEKPFLHKPTAKLQPLPDDINSDESSSEVNLVLNSNEPRTKVLFDSKNKTISDSDYFLQDGRTWSGSFKSSDMLLKYKDCSPSRRQTILCYNCPELGENSKTLPEAGYEHRANNLIKKLREIKMQNVLLQKELMTLKEESQSNQNDFSQEYNIIKVDHSTSPLIESSDSKATLKSLKNQLQDIQDSRNVLIQTINSLQDQLDNFNELKKNQIEDIEANHKLQLIKVRTSARDEMKALYEKKFEDLKQSYEDTITKIQETAHNEIKILTESKDEIIFEKNKLLEAKNIELDRLKQQVENEKFSMQTMLNKLIEKSSEDSSYEGLKMKNQLLERRLTKIEKAKMKCAKIYEAKIAQLQREKHLTECSLQLQLVRQRAQLVSEMTDENQTELNTSLEKLEAKYKEIVANVQATAIQRRMQDQKALESILQAACGIDDQNRSQNSRSTRTQVQNLENEISSLSRGNRVQNSRFGKSFGEDSFVASFCLNDEKMGELFNKVYVPQKDDCNRKSK